MSDNMITAATLFAERILSPKDGLTIAQEYTTEEVRRVRQHENTLEVKYYAGDDFIDSDVDYVTGDLEEIDEIEISFYIRGDKLKSMLVNPDFPMTQYENWLAENGWNLCREVWDNKRFEEFSDCYVTSPVTFEICTFRIYSRMKIK